MCSAMRKQGEQAGRTPGRRLLLAVALAFFAGCSSGPAGAPQGSGRAQPPQPRMSAAPLSSGRSAAPGPSSLLSAAPPVAPACQAIRVAPPALIDSAIDVAVPAIVDPNHTMEGFFDRVARLVRGNATDHVRIGVFGDSNMTMDWITGEMRRTAQGEYGDGGHGYVALGRPWNWYRHMDVRSGHDPLDYTPFAVSTRPSPEQCYGYAGIAARSERPGAVTWVATAEASSPIGTRASEFDAYFLRKPKGGTFEIRADGAVVERVSTESDRLEAGFVGFSLPDAPHRVEFVTTTRNAVTFFGVTLERKQPSIVVDSLGVGSASGPLLLRQNREVMREALKHRKYDLIILLLGGNQVWPVTYERLMGDLVDRLREALPGASVLITSPVDQVESILAWQSVPSLAQAARQNRKVAEEKGTAFWDFRGAMGGDASMARFIVTGMGRADGIHLSPKGAAYMGRRMLYALWRDLDAYLASHPEAGCELRHDGASASR